MIATALPYLLIALASQGGVDCSTDSSGFCRDQIVRQRISYTQRDAVVRVNAALGTALSVEFPPFVGLRSNPPVGNTAILQYTAEGGPKAADAPLRLTLWPKVPQGAGQIPEESIIGWKTNMHIMLDGGITITLEVKIAPPDESVQRLIFDFPERQQESEYIQERLAQGRQRILSDIAKGQEELSKQVKDEAQKSMARSMLAHVHCTDLRDRDMRDLLVVRAQRLCRIGEHIFIHFSIQNRARDLFSLGGVELKPAGDGAARVDAIFEYDVPGAVMLGYDGEVHGVAAFDVDSETAAKAYTLTVTEAAGKKRVVTLNDVSF